MVTHTPKHRWYQFRLRTLLLVMTVLCVAFAWIGWRMQRARVNRAWVAEVDKAVAAIEEFGGHVYPKIWNMRPQTWLEKQFDDPGSRDDPVRAWKESRVTFGASASITDAGLEHLSGLKHHLSGLNGLKHLDLGYTNITDAGLIHLKGLKGLYILNLAGTKVTDAGLDHLTGLNNLIWVDLGVTNVTSEGARKLQRALPNCKIRHHSLPPVRPEGIRE